jgi:hypothetical protein
MQFGAAAKRGWRVAWQLQRRAAKLSLFVGLVWSSRERIAESKAVRAVEAPCMGVPPVMAILVFGAGEEVRVTGALRDVGFGSEIRRPAAEGGGFGMGA